MKNRISRYYEKSFHQREHEVEEYKQMFRYPTISQAFFLSFAVAFGIRLGWALTDFLASIFDYLFN